MALELCHLRDDSLTATQAPRRRVRRKKSGQQPNMVIHCNEKAEHEL